MKSVWIAHVANLKHNRFEDFKMNSSMNSKQLLLLKHIKNSPLFLFLLSHQVMELKSWLKFTQMFQPHTDLG